MLGKNPGLVPSQGEKIACLFSVEKKYSITCVSAKVNRAARLADILSTLIRKRRDLDLVILDIYSGLNLFMAETVGWLCRKLQLPLIMVLHGGNLPFAAKQRPARLKRILSRADAITAPSKYLAEAIGQLGFEIEVIPNVVETGKYQHKTRSNIAPNLVWMRSFHPLYNPAMALRTLSLIKDFAPASRLTMAGTDKGCEREMRFLAAEMDLTDRVDFCGWLDEDGKKHVFEQADIYLNTNNIDNTPVSIIEACAFGLAVIATDVGGIPFLLNDGSDALLVPRNDAAAMANAVRRLLEDPTLVQQLSSNGKTLAERSSWKNVKPKWENKFNEVLALKRRLSTQPLKKTPHSVASRS